MAWLPEEDGLHLKRRDRGGVARDLDESPEGRVAALACGGVSQPSTLKRGIRRSTKSTSDPITIPKMARPIPCFG
jgi:hypothetical protein